MQDRLATYPRLTLARAVYSFVGIGVLLVGLLAAVIVNSRSEGFLDETLDVAVRVRANAAGYNLARKLHDDWGDLKFLAAEIPQSSPQRLTGLMDGMRGDANRISWIGYADISGQVLQASDDLLVGADVSARPWFRNGLQAPFAGDVHEAVLLSNILRSDGEEELRFVDLAMPVRNADGQAVGVIGTHINFAWAETILKEQAASLGLDVYLIGADGNVIVATNDTNPSHRELQILSAALPGSAVASREVWPDGRSYFSSLVPRVTYSDLPNFGWRLIGRLDGDNFNSSLTSIKKIGAMLLVALVCVLGVITTVFVMFFIRPLEELGAAADEIANGRDTYPPDLTRTREMAQLSASLARLQAARDG